MKTTFCTLNILFLSLICPARTVNYSLSPTAADKTIPQILSEIAEYKFEDNEPGRFRVLLAEGEYVLNTPLNFSFAGDLHDNVSITLEAQAGQDVSITGSRPVTGWKPFKGSIFVADVGALGIKGSFRQLYFRGSWQTLARTPNPENGSPFTTGMSYIEKVDESAEDTAFHFDPQSINAGDWANPTQAEICVFPHHNYGNVYVPIEKIDKTGHIIHLRKTAGYTPHEGERFFVQNVMEAIDAPGEWFHDAASGKLYFYPPDAKLPSDTDVKIPVAENIVLLKGTPEKPVRNIHFNRISFRGSRDTAVLLENAANCSFNGCKIFNAGLHGIYLRPNTRNCRIQSCDIYDTASCGIMALGIMYEHHRISGNIIDNCHIHDIGRVNAMEVAGVDLIAAQGNTISNCEIHDVPRWGIALNISNDILIEYNHVHHTAQCTEDAGAINTVTSWGGWDNHFNPDANRHIRGNIIRYNHVHHSGGYGKVAAWMDKPGVTIGEYRSPYFSWGIYLDLASSGTTVFGNIVHDCFMGAFIIGGGSDNIFENNIMVNNALSQFYTCKWSDHYPMSGNHVRRNVMMYNDPLANLYRNTQQHGRLWSPLNIDYNFNLVWAQDNPISVHNMSTPVMDWDAWLKTGMDKDSVIADPLFVDAENGDYRLRPESPAFHLGFKPIPHEKIGLYTDEFRSKYLKMP